MIVRSYREEDEGAVVELWRVCFPDDPPRNEPRGMIARKLGVDRDLFLVGTIDEQVVATAIGGWDGVRGWVYHLAITPERRRNGLARRMMEEVESRLRMRGCPKLNLQVRSHNAAVIGFYRALGYRVEENVGMGKVL